MAAKKENKPKVIQTIEHNKKKADVCETKNNEVVIVEGHEYAICRHPVSGQFVDPCSPYKRLATSTDVAKSIIDNMD